MLKQTPNPAQIAAYDRVTIRPAVISDMAGLLALGRASHGESRFEYLAFDEEKCLQLIQRQIGHPGQLALLVAERSGRLVGYLGGQIGEALFSRDLLATVIAIFVLPEARNGLAAVKLLQAFRGWAKRRAAKEIHVNVTSGVHIARTDRFLRRMGFRQAGGNYVDRL